MSLLDPTDLKMSQFDFNWSQLEPTELNLTQLEPIEPTVKSQL